MNEDTEETPDQNNTAPPAHQPAGAIPSIDSATLLQNHRELLIRHGNELYRLRLTKSGKLILHK